MTALAASRTLIPSWFRAVVAVLIGATFAGLVVSVLQLVLAPSLEWPEFAGDVPGVGWPWPVDGPWSLAADLGPALLFGVLFAWGADILLRSRDGVTAMRAPVVLTAAAITLVVRSEAEGALLIVSLPFTAVLVIVTRASAARPRRPLRWTRTSVALLLLAGVGLTAATASYGRLNALSADSAEYGRAHVTIPVQGIGNDIVNLISVRVPDAPPGVTVGVWNPGGTSVASVRGVSTHSGEVVRVALQVPQRCSGTGTIDRLDVRMHVGDRELHQVVRLDAPVELCA